MRIRTLVTVGVSCLILAGCGSSGSSSDTDSAQSKDTKSASAASDGKSAFVASCGGCHTLADAGTSGQVGPELTGKALSAERVADQIKNGGGAMSPGILEGDEAAAVAAYVAKASK